MEPKHERSFVDYDRTYETNLIGLRGIIYFGVGLFLLIVITFGLMFFLLNVMEDQAKESKDETNPMMMTDRERLPPEPRLQAAPGFGVESDQGGRLNMELRAPQSEYWELERQWEKLWAEGQQDPKTGTIITLPIEEAKQKLLQENVKTRAGEQSQKSLDESRSMTSYSSAGRTAIDKRR
ncbi:MAG: hypothetical protein M3R11_08190 [Acidobacteriota bacterium]|jgi:hypothetical protein|nr:hypothetical protein [Acidobacteriota bacterium]